MLNYHDFSMATILQNTFSVYRDLLNWRDESRVRVEYLGHDELNYHHDSARTGSFCALCLELADQIFDYSFGIVIRDERFDA